MSIHRDRGVLTFECDSCDELFEWHDVEEFGAAWNDAKHQGWRAKKIGTEWVHTCPDCSRREI